MLISPVITVTALMTFQLHRVSVMALGLDLIVVNISAVEMAKFNTTMDSTAVSVTLATKELCARLKSS